MISIKNGRYVLTPLKKRFGNGAAAILPDDFVIFSQAIVKDGSGNLSSALAFTANNTHTGVETFSGTIVSSGTTDSTSTTTGDIKTAGGLGVAKNAQVGGQFVISKNIVRKTTPYTAAVDTTAGWTLAEVKTALIAGAFKTTSAAAVTLTLDSVANIITSFATAGVPLGTGSTIEFSIDNTAGANTVTLAVDGGATIAVATPVITGGATLTTSTANKIGRFQLYLSSTTAGILSRVV